MLDARLGRTLVKRALVSSDDVELGEESNLMDLDRISEPKAILHTMTDSTVALEAWNPVFVSWHL
jgi:hypothetical protein